MGEGQSSADVARRVGLFAGPIAAALVAFVPSGLHEIQGFGHRPAYAAAVVVWMAIWWFTEALPIGWTACLPLVLYPLFGVFGRGLPGDLSRAALPYVDAYIFLFLGGMAIGAAMEEWGLHRRIALHIMLRVGTDPRRLLLGMLVATASISLWISNTATAVMMLPIGLALVRQFEAHRGGAKLVGFGTAIMLAIAYGSNVGGIGTKIGTPTNSVFAGFVADKMGRDLGFLEFMAVGVPFVVLFIPLIWWVLWRLARVDALGDVQGRDVIVRELSSMGSMSRAERKVAAVFVVTALLWMFSDLLRPLVAPLIPKLYEGYRFAGKHYEAYVAVLAALTLVAIRGVTLKQLSRVPWSALLLLGGSFAMAQGIDGSGLSGWMARGLASVGELPAFVQLLMVSGVTVFLSAIASNTATLSVMVNVLPRSLPLLAASTLAASCDFALPAGTPPNAIVFGSGYIRLPTMMRVGVLLDMAAVLLIAVYAYVWVARIL